MQVCRILPCDVTLQLFCLRFPFRASSSSVAEGPGPLVQFTYSGLIKSQRNTAISSLSFSGLASSLLRLCTTSCCGNLRETYTQLSSQVAAPQWHCSVVSSLLLLSFPQLLPVFALLFVLNGNFLLLTTGNYTPLPSSQSLGARPLRKLLMLSVLFCNL